MLIFGTWLELTEQSPRGKNSRSCEMNCSEHIYYNKSDLSADSTCLYSNLVQVGRHKNQMWNTAILKEKVVGQTLHNPVLLQENCWHFNMHFRQKIWIYIFVHAFSCSYKTWVCFIWYLDMGTLIRHPKGEPGFAALFWISLYQTSFPLIKTILVNSIWVNFRYCNISSIGSLYNTTDQK